MVGNDYVDPDFVYFNNPFQPCNFNNKVHSTFRHHANHTMGVDFGDINNDGLSDIMALDMLAEPPMRRQELMTTMTLDRQTTLTKHGYGYQQMRNMLQLTEMVLLVKLAAWPEFTRPTGVGRPSSRISTTTAGAIFLWPMATCAT